MMKNSELFKKYLELAKKEDKVIFGGRLECINTIMCDK